MAKTTYQALDDLAEANVKLQEVKEYLDGVIHDRKEHDNEEINKIIYDIAEVQLRIKNLMKWFLR